MNAREIQRALAAADPVGGGRLDGLDFEAMEADLLADIDGEEAGLAEGPARPHPRRRLVLALGGAALAIALAAFLIFGGSGSGHPSRAYGADLIRFAESTPLLLLEGPGWRVQEVVEYKTREGNEGQMEFVTGKAVPWGSIRITGNIEEGERESGLQPAAVRQRKVELTWRNVAEESLAQATANLRGRIHPHGKHFVRLPVLGTTAFVDTRSEIFVNQGGPGDREMIALWTEGDHLLQLRASVPDRAAFEERLGWLTKVDSQTWLEAMPAKVVKAADFESTVEEMLKGIPLPQTFALSRIPDEGLTTSRGQVAGLVTNTVACLWFRQWGEAVRSGDTAARTEAEKALMSSPNWPILRQENNGHYQGDIWKFAMAMPQGYWDWHGHHRSLLAHAEGLGCARYGLPLLPSKMKLQRERGAPLPPD